MLIAVSLAGCLGGGGDEEPSPEASSASPSSGPATGGTIITVSGTGFEPGATARVGGLDAQVLSVTDDTVRLRSPAAAVGMADIVITNPDGQTATLAGAFQFIQVTTTTSTTTTTTAPVPEPAACRVWVDEIKSARFAQGSATPQAHWRVVIATAPESATVLGAVVTAEIVRIASDGSELPDEEPMTETSTTNNEGEALFAFRPTGGFGNFRLTVLGIAHEVEDDMCDYEPDRNEMDSKDQNVFL